MTNILPTGQNESALADLAIKVAAMNGQLLSLSRFGACHMAYGGGVGVFVRIWSTTFAAAHADLTEHPQLGISKDFLKVMARDYDKRLPDQAKTAAIWGQIIGGAEEVHYTDFHKGMALLATKDNIDPAIASRCLLSNRMMSTITAKLINYDLNMAGKTDATKISAIAGLRAIRGIQPATMRVNEVDYVVPYVPHYFMVAEDDANINTTIGQFKIVLAYYSIVAGRADSEAAAATSATNQAAETIVPAFERRVYGVSAKMAATANFSVAYACNPQGCVAVERNNVPPGLSNRATGPRQLALTAGGATVNVTVTAAWCASL